MLRHVGRERCPAASSWYKRTDLAYNQKLYFNQQLLGVAVFSAAYELVCQTEENILRRGKSGTTSFFINSSKFLYQDSDLNKVTTKRIKDYERPQSIHATAQYNSRFGRSTSLA